jgi:hypothetical protein
MARIPDEEIERLKREIKIERLVTGFGVELKGAGANLVGRCPFHDDRTPSLIVTPETNLWRCMGECNIGGSTIDWVMRTQGVSFRHAAELLRADHPALAAGPRGRPAHVVRKGATVKLASPVAPDADDQQTLRDVVVFYHETLRNSPEALRYLEGRGLTHPEMIGHFKLGFANRKLGLTLPDKNRKTGADLRGRLQRLGILRAESGHEHMNGSVVFPIFDLAGNVAGVYGRKINNNLRAGTPQHTYLPGPHRGVWNEEALVASNHPVRVDHRRADVLVRGVPQRDGQLRREWIYGRSPGGVSEARDRAGVDCLRPRRCRRGGGRAAQRRTAHTRHRIASRAVSAGHGCQRICAHWREPGGAAQPRHMVRKDVGERKPGG